MIPANKLGSSVAESDGVRKDQKSTPQGWRSCIITNENSRRNMIMKKMLALVLAIAMLLSLASVASATTYKTITVSCTDTTSYELIKDYEEKTTTEAAIYVYHYDYADTDEYTNHFRGQQLTSGGWVTRGSKWCTQYLDVPIQNKNIVVRGVYSVSARGNTNYYNYDGISQVQLFVRFNPNH